MTIFGVGIQTFLLFILLLLTHLEGLLLTEPQVPCFFIFGDSLSDNGNNNNLGTSAKANYLPYGIDFPQGPTGRFTNGQNIADVIANLLGFNSPIPPYASARDQDILRGVNYASGASGIRSESGQQVGDRISLNEQLLHHRITVSRIEMLLGSHDAARHHLNKCLYYFNIGSNDYINNYFVPEYYNTSRLYNPEEYAAALMEQLSHHLEELYHLGSRKVGVSALFDLGCIPAVTSQSPNKSTCNDSMNEAVDLFNEQLKVLVHRLNDECGGADYSVIRSNEVNPPGMELLMTPCCKVSDTTGLCIPGEPPCPATERHLYAFFDNYHPTEVAYRVLGANAYTDIALLINQI